MVVVYGNAGLKVLLLLYTPVPTLPIPYTLEDTHPTPYNPGVVLYRG